MNGRILVVLGAPNASDGKLSSIAVSRLDLCLVNFRKGDMILCTGGWGEHFNKSDKPHSYHAKKYLMGKGISESCFLENALSSNTVEDAVQIKSIVAKSNYTKLIIITSDFHLDRVQLIFKEILQSFNMEFLKSTTILGKFSKFKIFLISETEIFREKASNLKSAC